MFDKFVLKGKYCNFDYSNYPGEFDRAKALLEYFDEKFPKVYDALGLKLPDHVIKIFFGDRDGAGCDTKKFLIEYGIHNPKEDFGCLIHEAVHFAQSYEKYTYNENLFLAQGMADYFRIKLSNDRCWDNPSDQFPCSHSQLDKDCSKCGARFLMWLEEKSKDENLAIKINNTLKENRSLDALFVKVFKKKLAKSVRFICLTGQETNRRTC